MYLGLDDEHRIEQLESLDMLLHGYQLALHTHGVVEVVGNFQRQFGDFIAARYPGSHSIGPISAIIDSSADGHEAWRSFWTLVNEFKDLFVHQPS